MKWEVSIKHLDYLLNEIYSLLQGRTAFLLWLFELDIELGAFVHRSLFLHERTTDTDYSDLADVLIMNKVSLSPQGKQLAVSFASDKI